jgi:hypothetical protein
MPRTKGSRRSKRASRSAKKVQPELERQLAHAELGEESVEAVVTLGDNGGSPPHPDAVDELAQRAIDRTQRESGEDVEDVNVLRHIALLVVRAKPRFIRSLLEQPEVKSAVANRQQAAADKGS